MADIINVSGLWSGAYYQHDQHRAISAEFLQAGEVLTGWMRDGEPDQEMSVSEVDNEGEGPGWDERIVARLREIFPDSQDAPIRLVTHLPAESTLQGWVRDSGVHFLKSYSGTSFGGFRVGDKLIGQKHDNPLVHYSGRVDPTGTEIEGRWWIEPTAQSGGRRAEGSFRLGRRVNEPADTVNA